jgi:SHS2 domain-containing protein
MYRFAEHTGEVELELEAPTEEGIFEAAVEAYAELSATDGGGEPVSREFDVLGRDRALLLVDVLNELVYLAETEGVVPERLTSVGLGEDRLRATVAGRLGEPRHLVKAVTLNKLEFAQEGGVWHGRVVLDV